MNRKTILMAVILVLVMALAVGCDHDGSRKEETSGTSQGTENPGDQTGDGDLDGVEGVEDSIFDDENLLENDTSAGDENPPQNNTSSGEQNVDDDKDDEKTENPSGPVTNPGTDTTPPVTDDTTEQDGEMTYEKFMALTPTEQREYQESFNDIDAFFQWYNAAKEKYEKEHPSIEVDGPIDMEQIAGGNG